VQEHLYVELKTFWEPLEFELPQLQAGRNWARMVDTPNPSPEDFADRRQDLDGCISQEQIRQTVYEVAARYQDAKISTFIPIFIRRATKERLGLLRNRKSSSAS